MKPKVLSNDVGQQTVRSWKLPWQPGIVLALAVLISLFAIGSAVSAQSGPEGILADPWATSFCLAPAQCAMGDFNGDGKDDIISFQHSQSPAGYVYVRLSNGSSFDPVQLWHTNFCVGTSEICKVADVNGDQKDDVIAFVRGSSGNVWVARSLGSSFESSATIWKAGFCIGNEVCDVGDYTGDGKADIATFLRSTDLNNKPGWVYIAKSNGTQFGTGEKWVSFFCIDQEICGSGDFNGDGKDDLITFRPYQNLGDPYPAPVFVAISNGVNAFTKRSSPWRELFCGGQEICGVGDFNNDGKDDVVTYLRSTWSPDKVGWVYVALSDGSNFPSSQLWSDLFCIGNQFCGSGRYIDGVSQTSYSQVSRTGDFNGDGRDDVVAFLRSTELSTKPGWVYVKLAYANQFVDAFPNLPRKAWVPLIVR
jgi:FG-GAP-like repeat